jgi:hypothetical protein
LPRQSFIENSTSSAVKGWPVAPLHAGAQVERELRRIGRDVPARGDARQHVGEGEVPARQALVADHAEDAVVVGGAAEAAAQRAAVAPDALDRRDDERIGREALRERGQLVRGDLAREVGRLAGPPWAAPWAAAPPCERQRRGAGEAREGGASADGRGGVGHVSSSPGARSRCPAS